MRIWIDVRVSSASLKDAREELSRQLGAMELRYPEMVRALRITGQEAGRRLMAQRVALETVAELERRVRQEEYASSQFGPADEGCGPEEVGP